MTFAIILPDNEATSGVIAYRDPIITTGSLWCLDLADTYCFDPATQVVANGAVIRNLVEGAPSGHVVMAVGGLDYVANKGLRKLTALNTSYLEVGGGLDYLQTNLSHDFLFVAWAIYPASDPSATGYFLLNKSTTNANTGPGMRVDQTAGYAAVGAVSGKISQNAGNSDIATSNIIPINGAQGLHQIAISRVGDVVSLYRDGVMVGTPVTAVTAFVANTAPVVMGARIGSGFSPVNGMIMCRTYAEDLTISGRGAATAVSADYVANSARFV